MLGALSKLTRAVGVGERCEGWERPPSATLLPLFGLGRKRGSLVPVSVPIFAVNILARGGGMSLTIILMEPS